MGAGLLRATYGKRQSRGIEFANVPANGKNAGFQPANSTPNVSSFNNLVSVGYDYNLSKRTALYGTYTRAKSFDASIGSFNVIQLGVGHNF
jgi:predicted porin